MAKQFIVFAGNEDPSGGIYDMYKMTITNEEAVIYFKKALFVEDYKWAHILCIDSMKVILDSKNCDMKKMRCEYDDSIAPLPELDLSASENWIQKSSEKFKKYRDPKYIGFNNETNILIPDNRLIVGGYPKYKQDFERMKEMGIDTIVCLNDEYGKTIKGLHHSEYSKTEDINGMEFIHVPIPDMDTVSDKTIMDLCRKLTRKIVDGRKVFIHCSGGHGRTGTVACVLLHLIYPDLTIDQIYDYVQFSHDQRTGSYGYGFFTYKLNDHNLAACFQNGQVPTPQTANQRFQVRRIIMENKAYLEAKKNYDSDIHLQQHIAFEDWYQLMMNYDAEEKKLSEDQTIFDCSSITYSISRVPEFK